MTKQILLGALIVALPCMLGQAATSPLQQISLNQYSQELDRLRIIAETCAQELSQRNAASGRCDPSIVGPDVAVSITNGKRTVSFEWLRDALNHSRGKLCMVLVPGTKSQPAFDSGLITTVLHARDKGYALREECAVSARN